jgi:hypothetical protein
VANVLALPLEIQTKIFTIAHCDNPRNEALRLPEEVVLSHVCSQWRNISINLPTLWTAFKFDSNLSTSAPVEKLEEYLQRSGTRLLELYFNISLSDYDGDPDDYEGFTAVLDMVENTAAYAHRWRRFTFFIDEPLEMDVIWDNIRDIHAPNLEYFAMSPIFRDRVLFGGAPKLSIFRIDAASLLRFLPPLSNITTLTIQQSPEMMEFSFPFFHSILTIPTLTNLSIESAMNFGTVLIGDPETLLRVVTPALKTLRIMLGQEILGILSFLDAPVLETLVLRNLDLASVYIGQNIDQITSFPKLNTIALIDCRCGLQDAEPDGIVAIILNKLAFCTINIVISTCYGFSSDIEGSTHLNFNRCTWPRLRCITLDLPTFSNPKSYERYLEHSPCSIILRVVQPLLQHWESRQPNDLRRLENVCKLNTMMVGDLMMGNPWPVPGGKFQKDESYITDIWGEILYARGPPINSGEPLLHFSLN